MSIEFKEIQRFTQWWLWLFLLPVAILPAYGIHKQLILGQPIGDKPMPNAVLILFTLLCFSILFLFRFMKLKTEIDKHCIRWEFVPFTKKRVLWSEVKSARTVNYGFVGGWGIRLGSKYGTVYNTRGNKGLAVELKNGKKFCIGTQREDDLEKVISKIMAPVQYL